MNNSVFGKNHGKRKKHRDIKLVITEKRNFFVSKPNYDPTKFFSKKKKKYLLISRFIYVYQYLK